MRRITLKQRIKSYLAKKGEFVNGGEIERLAMSVGYKGSTASRICRTMAEDGEIRRQEDKGSVWYRTLTPLKKTNYYRTLPDGTRELIQTRYE